jgi:hypothetical protein
MASKRWIGALLATALIVSSAPQSWAQDRSQAQTEPGAGATAAAVASNVLYVPGKVIVCTTSGVLWIATMALTFGTLYREAGEFVQGGCGGNGSSLRKTWTIETRSRRLVRQGSQSSCR